ncbi:MAG: winged helix-turn-helix transcriptional regulator [Fimbriimonadia bacterium]|jgi:ArsR family transcriptional regulator
MLDDTTRAALEAKAAVIKALAHPTRLFIAMELAKGERCVCELTDLVGDDVSTVSRHLSVMRAAGVVADRRVGTKVICSLRVPCLQGFLDCVDRVLEATARQRYELAMATRSAHSD